MTDCFFSNPYIASPTSQLILQPFRRFIYSTAHSTLPPLHLRQRSFYNHSVASPTSQALHVLHLASRPCIGEQKTVCGGLACYSMLLSLEVATVLDSHSSFSNPSAALPTPQLILQPFRCFTYVIGTSPTSPGEPPMPL